MKGILAYTTNKKIMNMYGPQYGWSCIQRKIIKIEHIITAVGLTNNDKSISFIDGSGRRLLLNAIEIINRGNSYVISTLHNIYVFERRN